MHIFFLPLGMFSQKPVILYGVVFILWAENEESRETPHVGQGQNIQTPERKVQPCHEPNPGPSCCQSAREHHSLHCCQPPCGPCSCPRAAWLVYGENRRWSDASTKLQAPPPATATPPFPAWDEKGHTKYARALPYVVRIGSYRPLIGWHVTPHVKKATS